MGKGRALGVVALAVASLVGLAGCTTTGDKRQAGEAIAPPKIYANMPIDKALQAGINFGGDTLTEVKRLIWRRKDEAKAAPLLKKALQSYMLDYKHNQLINAGSLYGAVVDHAAVDLFQSLIASSRPLARQLGWQLAAVKPAPELARAIDHELSRALAESDMDSVLIPQVANAVRANHMTGSYTLMRQGLMTKGDEEFVLAMIELDPERASNDFLAYLALAPAEELRQLTLASVNTASCVAILRHMRQVPPTIAKAGFDHLFLFAVSRNTALAELAEAVLETYVPSHTDILAQLLARHPAWVQMAYLDNVERHMDPKVGLLLNELKKTTAEQDVVQEIEEAKM